MSTDMSKSVVRPRSAVAMPMQVVSADAVKYALSSNRNDFRYSH